MILFLDTSALVKLYVQETHSDIVEKAVAAANDVIVSQITLAEAVSAFHYRALKNELSNADETRIFRANFKKLDGFLSSFCEETEWKQRAVCNGVKARSAITYLQTALSNCSRIGTRSIAWT